MQLRRGPAKEMAIIAEIGRIISSTMNIEEVYERFAEEVRKLIPFDRIVINIIDVKMNVVTNVYMAGKGIGNRKVGVNYPLEGSGNFEMVRTRSSLLLQTEDFDEYRDRFPMLLSTFQAGFRSIMNVPIFSKGEIIGGLLLRCIRPYAYTEKDVRLAERVGNQIAGAIANAQLFAALSKTENSLRASEVKYREWLEFLPIAIFEVDAGANITLFNRAFLEIFGYAREEAEKGLHALQFFGPAEWQRVMENMQKVIQGTSAPGKELTFKRRDESTFPGLVYSRPIMPEDKTIGIRGAIIDITERKRMEEAIREISLHDPLTELYNRRGFTTLAEQQLKAAHREKRRMTLSFIDVDQMKWINDTLGHDEGDKALIDAANILRQTFRESDIIARVGGDEFAVLTVDAAEMNSETFSKRLQGAMDQLNAEGSRKCRLAMSQGAAIYDPESPMSLSELMSSADELMYAQKKIKMCGQN
jgi:diguanylate cyclase (GGDEF)-like protein/PAS domain S-box-containing protein